MSPSSPNAASPNAAFDLTGKVAVVTGALGLLGREHCAGLAEAGARIVATDLNADGLGALAEQLRASGAPDALAVPDDITKPGDVDALRDAVLGRFGQIDILVNNAAIDDKFGSNAAE